MSSRYESRVLAPAEADYYEKPPLERSIMATTTIIAKNNTVTRNKRKEEGSKKDMSGAGQIIGREKIRIEMTKRKNG